MSLAPDLRPARLKLLSLSDELLLNIVQNLDRHVDVPNTRLSCRKLNDLTETYFFRNLMITLPEVVIEKNWHVRLRNMPQQLSKTKQFTVLNQRRVPGGYFYTKTISAPHSFRIQRWRFLDDYSAIANAEFGRVAVLVGIEFHPHIGKFAKRQLTAFRWRHAMPLSLENLTPIIDRQSQSLHELEISMLYPPKAEGLRKFKSAIKHKKFPLLKIFKYHGLSHTEPLPINRPERGGRSRMLRPLFQKFHQTLEELLLTQDHCISQVGKTPMTLGRTFYDTLCSMDDLYIDVPRSHAVTTEEQPPITLTLKKLELGGFRVANLFDIPATPTAAPRVRINLPLIRRLVLNNCFGVETLLQKLCVRKEELNQLTEFGVRIEEDNSYSDGLSDVFQALRDFLLCFKGLEVLSVLVDGDASGLRIGKDVLVHHAKTLRAYSVATRTHIQDEDEDTNLRFVSIPTYGKSEIDEISPGHLSSPPALREYGTFLNKIIGGEYARLRYLSQFPDLRTVVIRNFPPLTPQLKEIFGHGQQFWEDDYGRGGTVLQMAGTFAEQIALPFYALPAGYQRSDNTLMTTESLSSSDGIMHDDDFDSVGEEERIVSELKDIADTYHTPARDKILGFTLTPFSSSPTPKTDPTRDVLKQKARVDPVFRDVMRKVDSQKASIDERDSFDSYQSLVQSLLGFARPHEDTKPKLRLLVVGDWSYRDQMNITGPRRWDPTAWSYGSSPHATESLLDADMSDEEVEGRHIWNNQDYEIRSGFHKEHDVGLLPIFFAIDWVVANDSDRGRYRWKAKATILKQDTLEGKEALSNIRLLDFAWMT